MPPAVDPARRFAATYEEARQRFCAAVRAHPGFVDGGALEVGAGLTIDWGFTGDRDGERLLVYSSGLHGIEGYVGSAAQLHLLAEAEGTPTLWLHALNPFGMKHLRRVNENNVDLNRNFLPPGEPYRADDAAYARLDPLLNPPRPPGLDLFWPTALYSLARHGLATLRNVVARGQYSFPRGIFYGGDSLQAGPGRLIELLAQQLPGKQRVMHIDLHTARGRPGEYVAFLEGSPPPEQLARGRAVFGPGLRVWAAGTKDGYDMRGGMLAELARRFARPRFDGLTVEFGTASDLAILRALRLENQLHFHGRGDAAPDHPAKLAMRRVFAPLDEGWQRRALSLTSEIGAKARAMLE